MVDATKYWFSLIKIWLNQLNKDLFYKNLVNPIKRLIQIIRFIINTITTFFKNNFSGLLIEIRQIKLKITTS